MAMNIAQAQKSLELLRKNHAELSVREKRCRRHLQQKEKEVLREITLSLFAN